jgi:general secretion pathway protein B
MSYILDALKKAEKERKRGMVPDLLTVQDAMVQKPKKRLHWSYLIFVALLLNASVLMWWLSPWQSKKPNVVAQSTAVHQRESKLFKSDREISDARLSVAAPSSIPEKVIRQGARADEKKFSPKSEATVANPENPVNVVYQNKPLQVKAYIERKAPSKPITTANIRGSHKISPSIPKQTPAATNFSNKPQSSINTGIVPEQKVFNLKDLPLSIQQSLPAFSISVSVYSDDPDSRMIKINGQRLQEGQYLTAGLKLEEITRDGAIFSYQKYRFRVGIRP